MSNDKSKTILLVDDVEDNRVVVKLALKNYKYEYLEASDGEEGVAKAIEHLPNLIVMDLMMPIKDGFTAISEIRAHESTSRIPILVVTSYDDAENKIRALDCGATDFLTKPFDKTELRVRVSSILDIYTKFFEKERELTEINDNLEELVLKRSYELIDRTYKDSLTGLYNRAKLINDMQKMKRASIVMIDIDNFGEINNFYGNESGDAILKEFANRVSNAVNSNYFYRSCADSFVVLSSCETEELLKEVCQTIDEIACKESYKVVDGHDIYINITIGASLAENGINKAILEADAALEYAKNYKKRFVIHTKNSDVFKNYKENIEWTNRVINALREDRVFPVFQPIVKSDTEEICKYESLVRIKEGDTLISPFYFLEIAKKAKLYTEITKVVVTKTLEAFRGNSYEFSINLSSHDICDDEIAGFIIESFKNFKGADRAIFEILESDGIENYEKVIEFISEVKKLGCRVALDDFGSGYSNFSHIMKLDIDIIKIDGSLIKEFGRDQNSRKVVETIVNFSKELQIKTVAEFVSTKEIADISKEIGIDYLQGYYYGKPDADIKS